MIDEQRKAYKRYKLSQTAYDLDSYVNLKRECEKEIRKYEREYEVKISLEAKKNPKMPFSYIRNKNTVRDNIDLLIDNDNELISDGKGHGLHS